MKRNMKQTIVALLATALTMLFASQVLAAAGDTEAGITISNTATVNFTIGGGSPPPVTGSYDFVVDHKIRPVVASVSGATVVPNGDDYVLQFTVTNDGNTQAPSTLQMLLEAVAGTSDFPMSNVEIWQEDDTNAGYQSGEDTNITADPYIMLARDTSATIYIVADAPNGITKTQVSRYHLRATATDGSKNVLGEDAGGATPGTNNADESEAVFADDASASSLAGDVATDGKHSDQATYTVNWTDLGVSKSANNGGSGYHLPGDIITYTITVTNSDTTNGASGVTVSDPIPTNTTYVAGTLSCSASGTGSDGSAEFANDGTNFVDGDTVSARAVRCDSGSIDANGGTLTMTFNVKID